MAGLFLCSVISKRVDILFVLKHDRSMSFPGMYIFLNLEKKIVLV